MQSKTLRVLDMKNKTIKIIRDNPRVIFAETEISGSVKMKEAVEYKEKNYPKMALEFKNICQEQYELFCTKQFNYGPSNIAVGTDLKKDEDVKLSLTGLWFRMNDKIQRLKNLLIFEKFY